MPRLTRDNFSISEMSDCSLAERMGIDNTPSIVVLQNLSVTVTGLERMRALLGYPIHVNSGYRCEKLEKVLCQADYSTWCSRNGHAIDRDSWKLYFSSKEHPTGHAADFTCAQFGSPVDIVRSIQSSAIKFDVCILEGSWVHVSFAPTMRREVRIKAFDQFGVTATTHLQPESLDESHYATRTFLYDFQEKTRPARSPILKHWPHALSFLHRELTNDEIIGNMLRQLASHLNPTSDASPISWSQLNAALRWARSFACSRTKPKSRRPSQSAMLRHGLDITVHDFLVQMLSRNGPITTWKFHDSLNEWEPPDGAISVVHTPTGEIVFSKVSGWGDLSEV